MFTGTPVPKWSGNDNVVELMKEKMWMFEEELGVSSCLHPCHCLLPNEPSGKAGGPPAPGFLVSWEPAFG